MEMEKKKRGLGRLIRADHILERNDAVEAKAKVQPVRPSTDFCSA